jgi:hypothetical protein
MEPLKTMLIGFPRGGFPFNTESLCYVLSLLSGNGKKNLVTRIDLLLSHIKAGHYGSGVPIGRRRITPF